jgi:hypothetical protein
MRRRRFRGSLEDPDGDKHEQHGGDRDHLIGHVVAMARVFLRTRVCGPNGRCGLGVRLHASFAFFGSHLNKRCRCAKGSGHSPIYAQISYNIEITQKMYERGQRMDFSFSSAIIAEDST